MQKRIVVVVAVAAMGCAKIVVEPVKPNMGGEGVFYALPSTVVHVMPKVDRKTVTDAIYSPYAWIFSPLGKVQCGAKVVCTGKPGEPRTKTTYALQQGTTFATTGEPDPEQVYVVRFAGGGAMDQALAMTWTESGLMSAATASVTNRTGDVAVSGVKLLASLGSKVFGGSSTPDGLTAACTEARAALKAMPKPTAEAKANVAKACVPACDLAEATSKNDAWVIPALKDAQVTAVPNYCAAPVQKRDSLDRVHDEPKLRRAAAAFAANVTPLLNARINALNGTPGVDPVALVAKLDALIAEQVAALFLGTSETKTWEGSLALRSIKGPSDIPLFDIDKDKGICLRTELLAPDAKPFPDGFEHNLAKCPVPVSLRIALYPDAQHQLFTSAKSAALNTEGERGFRYRIPAQVRADLVGVADRTATPEKPAGKDSTVYGTATFYMAQLGTVATLPAKRNSKMLSYDLALVEATGGLKTFKLGSTGALDAATVDALSGAGGTVLDARNAARKQAATDADEVTILTRQQTLLKLKDEICALQQKYGVTCTVQP